MSAQKNGRTLFKRLFKGGAVVTMDSTVPNLATGDVLVDGDRIAAVGANLLVDDAQLIDAAGSIVPSESGKITDSVELGLRLESLALL
jgi:adenine deaminase